MGSENNMVAVRQGLDLLRDYIHAAGGDTRHQAILVGALARLAQPDEQQGASSPSSGEGVERAERRCRIQEALLATLDNGTYDCTRMWSAWQYGTMSEDDFVPVLDRLDELVDEFDAIIFRATPLAAATQPAVPQEVSEREALERALDRIDWGAINAFQAELRKGQDIYEDAGGFFARAIKSLFGIKPTDPVTTHRDAAAALVAALTGAGENGEQGA